MAESTGSIADGMMGLMNVFVDPQNTAKNVPSKLSWVWPVAVLTVGYLIFSYLMLPYTTQMVDASFAQRNMPPEQMDRARSIAHTMTVVGIVMTPIFVIGFVALFAWLTKLMYSILDIRPRFRDIFSLLAACSLIPFLEYVATFVVIKMKGDPIENPEQMQPPFGLDILFQGVHGATFALLHFFSIFEIWFLVVLVFGLAYLTKSSKKQALFVITPVWLVPLIIRMVSAMFQGGPR